MFHKLPLWFIFAVMKNLITNTFKKHFCAFLPLFFLLLPHFLGAQIIQFSDANFKDALLNDNVADLDGDGIVDGDLDLNDDGEIQLSEAEAVVYLRIQSKDIEDVSEIFNFTNLETLRVANNLLTDIDISALTQLQVLDIDGNLFEELALENLESLEEVDFYPNENLRAISFVGCQNLTKLSTDAMIDKIDLSHTNPTIAKSILGSNNHFIDSIVVQNVGFAQKLSLSNSNFGFGYKYLDLRENAIDSLISPSGLYSNLETLLLRGNPINYLELNTMTKLVEMDLNEISSTLASIVFNNLKDGLLELHDFEVLHKIKSNASKVILSNIPNITHVQNFNTGGLWELKELTLSNMAGLEYIEDKIGRINKLSLMDLPALRRVTIEDSKFDNLVFDNLVALDTVAIPQTEADTIIFSNLPQLTFVDIMNLHDVEEIQIRGCSGMEELFRTDGASTVIRHLRSLVIEDMPNLRKLNIEGASISQGYFDYLTFKNLPLLDSIKIEQARYLKDLQIKDLPNLKSIIYSENHSDSFEGKFSLSNLPQLSNLYIHQQKIDSLILKDLPNLEYLYINRPSSYTKLDHYPLLKSIDLFLTQIDTLRLVDLPHLEYANLDKIGFQSAPVYLEFENLPNLHTLLSENNVNSESLLIENLESLTKLEFKALSSSPNEIFESLYLDNLPFLRELRTDYYLNPDSLYKTNLVDFINLEIASLGASNGGVFIDNLPSLTNFYFDGHFDDENFYDFSSCPAIESVRTDQWGTKYSDYNFKNGTNTLTYFESNGRIRNVCVDNKEEEDHLKSINDEMGNTFFTTDCPNNVIKTFNTIKGRLVFGNTPSHCQFANAYTGFHNIEVRSDSYNATLYSDQDGIFEFKTDNINEEIIITPSIFNPLDFVLINEADTLLFTDYDNVEEVKFCLNPITPFTDYEVYLVPLTSAVPGFEVEYKLIIKNVGTTALEGTGNLNLKYDTTVMTFIEESPVVVKNAPDSIGWYFVNVGPFQEKEIDIKFQLNTPTDNVPLNGGDILGLCLTVDPVMMDENTSNDEFKLYHEVVNSFDPNDITCVEGNTISKDYIGNSIHYMIRFENLGSASATNIFVTNRIDTTVFDLASFEPIMASDNMTTEVLGGDTLRFDFKNINLPHTGNNDGYLLYRIDIKDEVTIDDVLENDANIFFDFNAPIYTGLSEVSFKIVTNVDDMELGNNEVQIYPNPTADAITFGSEIPISRVTILNAMGSLVDRKEWKGNKTGKVNLEGLRSGVYSFVFEGRNGFRKVSRVMKR